MKKKKNNALPMLALILALAAFGFSALALANRPEDQSHLIDDLYRQKFWLHRHLAPTGYILSAKMIMSYMDYIIRHNMEDFKMVGFTGREKLLEQPEAYQPIY